MERERCIRDVGGVGYGRTASVPRSEGALAGLQDELKSLAEVVRVLIVAVELDDGVVQIADQPIQIDSRQLDRRDFNVWRECLELILNIGSGIPLPQHGAFMRKQLHTDVRTLRHGRGFQWALRESRGATSTLLAFFASAQRAIVGFLHALGKMMLRVLGDPMVGQQRLQFVVCRSW